MDSKKKKIVVISSIIVGLIAIAVIVYAAFQSQDEKKNRFLVGTLDIEIQNLDLKKNNTSTRVIMPGDIDLLSFTAANVGTCDALTRHTIDIYWVNNESSVTAINEVTEQNASNLLYLYPATMTDAEIMEDFNGEKSQKLSPVEVFPTEINKVINGQTVTVYGIRYKFVGNTLAGSDPQGVAESSSQNISFKLLLSPETSYLFQSEPIKIDVVTEGQQYTESGSGTWTVTDSEGI
jgi:hypothetical protein